jgi:hypothetical protein
MDDAGNPGSVEVAYAIGFGNLERALEAADAATPG